MEASAWAENPVRAGAGGLIGKRDRERLAMAAVRCAAPLAGVPGGEQAFANGGLFAICNGYPPTKDAAKSTEAGPRAEVMPHCN